MVNKMASSSMREYRARQRRRKIKKTAAQIGFFVLLIAVVLLAALLIVKIAAIISPPNEDDKIFTPNLNIYDNPEILQNGSAEATAGEGQTVGPVIQTGDDIKITAPSVATIALAENGRVDTSYFADAVFVGDSLTEGLPLYMGDTFPETTRFMYQRGLTPLAFMTGQWSLANNVFTNPIDDVVNASPAKIYIMMGTNSLANNQSDDVILKYYGQMIDAFKEKCPGAVIYVHSVLPTGAAKAAENAAQYGPERIKGLNEQLAMMSAEKGVCYLDLYSVIADADGNMSAEYAQDDGFHMNKAGYQIWADYLISHTKHSADNPYILGSPYYVKPQEETAQ